MPTDTSRSIAGRYQLRESLGRGGMGVVWAAEDSVLQRRVAVKEVEIPRGLSEQEQHALEARVMREARAAARLNHPNVVTVFDVVEDEGQTFIVMELVEAPSLSDVVRSEGRMSVRRAATVGLDVLGALEAAHAEGIVHRDVKPGNVMIPAAGPAKLGDFGIASVKGDPKITSTGLILGSPSYMSPEQASEGTSGPEADLWALGGLLYFALEGEPPFDKGQPLPTLAAVVGDPVPSMSNGGDLEPLIRSLLSKAPADRPAPGDIRDALTGAASAPEGRTTAVVPPPAPARETPSPSLTPVHDLTPPVHEAVTADRPSKRAPLAWIAVAALVIAAGFALWLVPRGEDGDPSVTNEGRSRDRVESEQGAGADAAGTDDRDSEGSSLGGGDSGQVDTSEWTPYTDEATGYKVSYPPEWSVSQVDSTRTDFTDPATGAYLRIDWTDAPGDDPVAAWESFEQDFASSHEGYERVVLEPATFKGMEAAWWEFTYTDGGAQLHAVDLGFVTNDASYGFALNFQTAAEGWEGSQDLFSALQDSFQIPRAH